MRILAVDTSTTSGSIAVMDKERLLVEWSFHSALTHNRRLLKSIDLFLHELGGSIDEVEGFAVTTGPGSFTGLRIGLTTMKTLAWSLGKPFVGIPSLDALAAPLSFASLPVCTLIDARKQEVYFALYQPDGRGGLRRESPYRVLPPQRVVDHIRSTTLFCGDGWLLYRDLLCEKLGTLAVEASPPFHLIRAGFVAEMARRRFERGEREDPMTSIPLYVRASEAELNAEKTRG